MPQTDVSSLNFLIVDDNATNREVLRGQLEHWGAKVFEAESGHAALKRCEERASGSQDPFFDVAFLDMQMPRMDGAQLGERLKADSRFEQMKLVMMTSMGHHGEVNYFAELGFDAYFPKPATTADLFAALNVVAEGGKALQEAKPLVTSHFLKTLKSAEGDFVSPASEPETQGGEPAHQPAVEDEKGEIVSQRLLLVEDNYINQVIASDILEELGFIVDVAGNGNEALHSLQHAQDDTPFSLVLMDCQMPEMDGYEASELIRQGKAGEKNKAIPILAMTANVMTGDREECLQAGMSDYLPKPIDMDLLVAKLQEWLPDARL